MEEKPRSIRMPLTPALAPPPGTTPSRRCRCAKLPCVTAHSQVGQPRAKTELELLWLGFTRPARGGTCSNASSAAAPLAALTPSSRLRASASAAGSTSTPTSRRSSGCAAISAAECPPAPSVASTNTGTWQPANTLSTSSRSTGTCGGAPGREACASAAMLAWTQCRLVRTGHCLLRVLRELGQLQRGRQRAAGLDGQAEPLRHARSRCRLQGAHRNMLQCCNQAHTALVCELCLGVCSLLFTGLVACYEYSHAIEQTPMLGPQSTELVRHLHVAAAPPQVPASRPRSRRPAAPAARPHGPAPAPRSHAAARSGPAAPRARRSGRRPRRPRRPPGAAPQRRCQRTPLLPGRPPRGPRDPRPLPPPPPRT